MKEICENCNGRGLYPCLMCGGTRIFEGKACPSCFARGVYACPVCGGLGVEEVEFEVSDKKE